MYSTVSVGWGDRVTGSLSFSLPVHFTSSFCTSLCFSYCKILQNVVKFFLISASSRPSYQEFAPLYSGGFCPPVLIPKWTGLEKQLDLHNAESVV